MAVTSHSTDNSPPRQPWQPDRDAHLIYQWVKLEGKSQSWVASAMNISQPTVSRIIRRYERWQAHATAREAGRLDRAERLRVQRWLTYERNELILSSCLRIAHELEGFTDVSKSTILRPMHSPSQQSEVRTEHAAVDRTGTVSRFLRLAFKVNMEQLNLIELAEPPLPEPLTEEELAEEERQAAADAAELKVGRSHRERPEWEEEPPTDQSRDRWSRSDDDTIANDGDGATESSPPITPDPTSSAPPPAESRTAESDPVGTAHPTPDEPAPTDHSPTHHSPALVNNLHNECNHEMNATSNEPCTCARQPTQNKNAIDTCIDEEDAPHWDDDEPVSSAPRRRAAAK